MKFTQEKNTIELSKQNIEAIKIAEEQMKIGEYIPFEKVFEEIRKLHPET